MLLSVEPSPVDDPEVEDDTPRGVVRVRYSYDGPLKEDKRGTGKKKAAPAGTDYVEAFAPLFAQREADGAQPEDYLIPYHASRDALKQRIEDEWTAAKARLRKREQPIDLGAMTFYEATRHSFVSRNRAAGVSLDEVSEAVGHGSPVVTKRYYGHFERRSFSAGLTKPLGGASGALVVPIPLTRNRSRRVVDGGRG